MIRAHEREEEAPDLIEPVVGFRAWHLRWGELRSPYLDVPWPAGALRAECLSHRARFVRRGRGHPEPAPAPGCACGIYAYFEPRTASAGLELVVGAVVLWGRVEVHRDGMRGEWARPVVLAAPFRPSRRRDELRSAAAWLGIQAVETGELETAALRHGRPVPSSLTRGL